MRELLKLLILISALIINGCFNSNQTKYNSKKSNEPIEIVRNFLAEPNPNNKLKVVREKSEYLKNNSVDLLVLDMIMKDGLDGFETYKKIIEIHPAQKAIIVSGYAESERVKKTQAIGAGAYIRKPYTLEKLGMAVKKELQR